MSPREEMLRCMKERARAAVPEGQPIVPNGAVATTQDMQEFKQLVQALGYEVKFGRVSAARRPSSKVVDLTGNCTVGVLTDEYLHVWNNFAESRGKYVEENSGHEHRALAGTFRLSGSSNDRRFHQLELENYVRFLENSGGAIPNFIWRTFTVLKRASNAGLNA
jgi:hypothetical protein